MQFLLNGNDDLTEGGKAYELWGTVPRTSLHSRCSLVVFNRKMLMNRVAVRALELILCRLRAMLQAYLFKHPACLQEPSKTDLNPIFPQTAFRCRGSGGPLENPDGGSGSPTYVQFRRPRQTVLFTMVSTHAIIKVSFRPTPVDKVGGTISAGRAKPCYLQWFRHMQS